jgi:hypothetical protein
MRQKQVFDLLQPENEAEVRINEYGETVNSSYL